MRGLSQVFLVLLIATALIAQDKSTSGPIKGSGCVVAGIESGCKVLRDLKTKELFNLFFDGAGPALDTEISFSGVKGGVTYCMQGKPVRVQNWKQVSLHCSKTGEAVTQGNGEKEMEGKCSNWKTWHDHQPPGPPTLHVTGQCEFKKAGYKVSLRPAVPQGFNPEIYILDRIVEPPTGASNDVITTVQVHYSEQTKKEYKQVTIMPDQKTINVDEVH